MTMFFNLNPAIYFYWVIAFMLAIAGSSFAKNTPAKPNSPILQPYDLHEGDDTIKYRGYRLDLTDFQIIKRTDDWVKIRCTIVNSGRMNVDFSKRGTEHWVQVNFDQTLFSNKLGGMRENIRQSLYDEEFKLVAGQTIYRKEMKVPIIVTPRKAAPPEPIVQGFETRTGNASTGVENPVLISGKGGEEAPTLGIDINPGIAEDCPDIYFHRLRIIEQDDKWATIEYMIANKGQGSFKIFEKGGSPEEHLIIKAFISGVPSLSRGALSAGGQVVIPSVGHTGNILPGGTYTGQMKVDVRKKTRYMKSLILSLDSDQFKLECDKTNNTDAVILD